MRVLIVGCGYVGRALGKALAARGDSVGAVVRTAESASALASTGWDTYFGDVATPEFWDSLDRNWERLIYCPSTGGGGVDAYRDIHRIGLSHALHFCSTPSALIYTSSTSVYGQDDGGWVDESSPTIPSAPTAAELVEAEQRVLNAGGSVLRLAGIYGPGRGVLLTRLRDGSATLPPGSPRWLNLIHRDDIVKALLCGIDGQLSPGTLYNVVDNCPSTYQEIYAWLCARLNLPMPPEGDPAAPRRRGMGNKRVTNRRLRTTGWAPEFPSFREGYGIDLGRD